MTRNLIINADDFGLNSGVNRGIIECHQKGIVTSTTLMVNCPGTKEAAELAKENPELGVGLHFNVTVGQPISKRISSLTDKDGFFWPRKQFEKKAVTGKIMPKDIEEELHLQWDILESLGITATHIDSHQHVHALPGISSIVLAFAKEKNVPVRIPQEKNIMHHVLSLRSIHPKNILTLLRKQLLNFYCQHFRRDALKQQVKTNDHFMSIFGFWPPIRTITVDTYTSLFKKMTEGTTELMVHPADISTPATSNFTTSITHISMQEMKLLQDPTLKKTIQACSIQLVSYKNM